MNSKAVLIVALSLLLANHFTNADGGLSGEAKTRRDSCGDLIKPHPKSGENFGSTTEGGCPCQNNDKVETVGISGATVIVFVETQASESSTGSSVGSTDAATTVASSSVAETATSSNAASSVGVTESSDSGCSCGTTGSNEDNYNCTLTDNMYEIGRNLSGADYELWIELITKIKFTILADSSLSSDQKIVKISYLLKAFFEVNIKIKTKLQFVSFGSWGLVIDLVYVGYEIQLEITSSLTDRDSNGDCKLYRGLRKFSNGDSEKEEAVEELIANINVILDTSSWSYTQKQAKIHLLFKKFFSVHADWEADFKKTKIEGYGLVEYYVQSTFWYYQITTISSVMGGSSAESVALKAIKSGYENTNYSITVRSQIKQLYDKLVVCWDNTTDISIRLKYFSSQLYSQYQLSVYLRTYIEQLECSSWGLIYDILFCSQICTNNGCGNINDGPGTTPVPTTTMKPADCSNRWSLLEVDANNETIFTKVVGEARFKWSASDRSSFNTYWNKIIAAIWGGGSKESIMEAVVTNCKSWNANNVQKQQLLYSVEIVEWSGTIQQFVDCGTQCNCS